MSSKLDSYYLPMELEACHSKVKLKRMISFDKGLSSNFQMVLTNLKPVNTILKHKETYNLDCIEVVAMPHCEWRNMLYASSKKKTLMVVDAHDFAITNTVKTEDILSYGSISKDCRTLLFGYLLKIEKFHKTTNHLIITFRTNSGKQYIYHTATNKLNPIEYTAPYKVHHTMFSNSDTNAIYCGDHKMCQVVDIEYNEMVLELQDINLDKNTIFNACTVNSGYILNSLVVAGDQEGKISIWNYIDGIKRYHFESDCKTPIVMIKFHPLQTVFAAAYADGKIEIIDLRSDCCISSLSVGSNDRVTCMEFSSSGRLLFYGTLKGLVNVWDICAEYKNTSINVFSSNVRGIALLPNEVSLVVGGASSMLSVYKRKKK